MNMVNFIHEIDGKIVSSLTFYWVHLKNRNVGVIEEVWTDESHRRKGYATMLIKKALSKGQELELDCIELTVREDRPDLQEFYKKIGFYDRHNKAMRYPIKSMFPI